MSATKKVSELQVGDILPSAYGTPERVEEVRVEGDKVRVMLVKNWDRPGRFLSQHWWNPTQTVTVTR